MALLDMEDLECVVQRPSLYLTVAIISWIILSMGRRVYKVSSANYAPLYGFYLSFKDILQNTGRNSGACKELERGYYECSKKDKPYWLNNFPHQPNLVLPPSEIQRLITQPERTLSLTANLQRTFAMEYTMPFAAHPTHEDIIRKYLTKNLDSLTADLADEVESAVEYYIGRDHTRFVEIPLREVVKKVLARTINRAFAGAPLCRDEEYLSSMTTFADLVGLNGNIINMVPDWVRPLMGPLVSIPNRMCYNKASRLLKPHIQSRIDSYKASVPHQDFITWVIDDAMKHSDDKSIDLDNVVHRLVNINFPAIHTSSLTITNTLLDIASSARTEDGAILSDALRREVLQATETRADASWTKECLDRLIRVDSAIKESMRLSGFFYLGTSREVMDPAGYQVGDINVPKGSNVVVSAYSIHHDAEYWNDPHQYDGLRFSRPREQQLSPEISNDTSFAPGHEAQLNKIIGIDSANSLHSSSKTFLAWGHGRKACPGRYFATDVMKLIVATIIRDYEIEHLETRPPSKWMANFIFPSNSATLKLRRRVEDSSAFIRAGAS